MLKKKSFYTIASSNKIGFKSSVEEIELCCSAVQGTIIGHCATASRLLRR